MASVVVNTCFGGFALSDEALRRLLELGIDVDCYGVRLDDDNPENDFEIERHDPRLVRIVTELGRAASARHSSLKAIPLDGDRYIIRNYDGRENVIEPENIRWRVIEPEPDKPEEGKVYALTGGLGAPSIESGASWAESAVPESGPEAFRQKLSEYPEEADKGVLWRHDNPDDESFDIDSAVRELIAPDAYATCSLCRERIELREWKDIESFTQEEVATHFKERHPEAVTPIGIPYCVITLE